ECLTSFSPVVSVSQSVEYLSNDPFVRMLSLSQKEFKCILSANPTHDLHDAEHGNVALCVLVERRFEGRKDRFARLLQCCSRVMAEGGMTKQFNQHRPRLRTTNFSCCSQGGVFDGRVRIPKKFKQQKYSFVSVGSAECTRGDKAIVSIT